jgi:segregation and condensation protein B
MHYRDANQDPAVTDSVGSEEFPLELLQAIVESLLFVSGSAVSVAHLEKALGVRKSAIESALSELEARRAGGGIRLQRNDGCWQLVTAPESGPYVEKFLGLAGATRLTAPALDTLAIVAYQQPVTRQQIEAVRGVDSSGVLNTLQARGFVEEVGRQETVGRPILYGTTFEFLRHFGLSSLKELPDLGADSDDNAGYGLRAESH